MQITEFDEQIQKLKTITDTKVDQKDYGEQLSRWNSYQRSLDEIEKKLDSQYVSLERNVKGNIPNMKMSYPLRHWKAFNYIAGVGMMALLFIFLGAHIAINPEFPQRADPPYMQFVGVAMISDVLLITIPPLMLLMSKIQEKHPPNTIKLSCSPILHIDEIKYVRNTIEGIPYEVWYRKLTLDPDVHLPTIRLKIPRGWISNESIRASMKNFENIKL